MAIPFALPLQSLITDENKLASSENVTIEIENTPAGSIKNKNSFSSNQNLMVWEGTAQQNNEGAYRIPCIIMPEIVDSYTNNLYEKAWIHNNIIKGTPDTYVFYGDQNGVLGITITTDLKSFTFKSFSFEVTDYVIECSEKDIFVITDSGLVYKSSDLGDTWESKTSLTSGTTLSLLSPIYINGKLVVYTGTTGCYVSENDGESWTKSQNLPSYSGITVREKDHRIILFGTNGRHAISTDYGLTWTIFTNLPGLTSLTVIFVVNDIFIASTVNIVAKSIDGINWTVCNMQESNVSFRPNGAYYYNSVYYLFSFQYSYLFTSISFDATNWSAPTRIYWNLHTYPGNYRNVIQDFGDRLLVLSAENTSSYLSGILEKPIAKWLDTLQPTLESNVYSPIETLSEEKISKIQSTRITINDIVYFNTSNESYIPYKATNPSTVQLISNDGIYVGNTLVSDISNYMSEIDLSTYTATGIFKGRNVQNDENYITNNGIINTEIFKKNELNWKSLHNDWKGFDELNFCNGKFYIFGNAMNASFRISEDLKNWTVITSPHAAFYQQIAYSGDTYVICSGANTSGGGFYFTYSTDGINWTQYVPNIDKTLFPYSKSIAYGNGKFVSFSYKVNTCIYSSDGKTNWNIVTLPITPSNTWGKVTFDGKYFVACYENGLIYSEDALSWSTVTFEKTIDTTSFCYANGTYLVFASDKKSILKSTNLLNWTTHTVNLEKFSTASTQVIFYQDSFIAIQSNTHNSAISQDGINWQYKKTKNEAWTVAAGNDLIVYCNPRYDWEYTKNQDIFGYEVISELIQPGQLDTYLKNTATGTSAFATGENATASANNTLALGYGSKALQTGATAIGQGAQAEGAQSIQLGYGTNSDAKTFKVGFYDASTPVNYELLDANGQIPAERLTNVLGDIETLLADL